MCPSSGERSLLLHPWDQLGFVSNRCPLRRKNFTPAYWGPASSHSGGTGLVCPTVLCPTASQYGSPGREEEEKDWEKEVMTLGRKREGAWPPAAPHPWQPSPPGKALTSMTACWPVWLLMMMSMPKSDTPSACRSARDSSRMTSSLGRSNTPSILSSCGAWGISEARDRGRGSWRPHLASGRSKQPWREGLQ